MLQNSPKCSFFFSLLQKVEVVENPINLEVEAFLKTKMMNPLSVPIESLSIKERLKS